MYRTLLYRFIVLLTLLFVQYCELRAQTPVASFTSSAQTGCAPLLVNFTSTSSNAISYQWDFGNTNSSTLANPTTVYVVPGIYTVSLTVTSAGGQTDIAFAQITVVDDPIADFSATPLIGCEDQNTISFTNLSSNATSWFWDFGDGSTSTASNPLHTYTAPGTFDVKLIAANAFGCQDIAIRTAYVLIHPKPNSNFSVNPGSSCTTSTPFQFTAPAGSISWLWDFGDGNTSSLQNPVHQYSSAGTYTVQLISTNSLGCSDTLVRNQFISVGSALIPSFTMSDTAGCGPLSIQFDCTVANASGWTWDFGDGTGSTSKNPSHTWTLPGAYTISLSVTTGSGCGGSVSYPGLVIVDSPPIPSFTATQDTGCWPFVAEFFSTSIGAATYLWDFGDGSQSTDPNPMHQYVTNGVFDVSLTAYSPNGCASSLTQNNFIRVFRPNAAFIGSPLSGCPGMNVQFNTSGTQTGIVSYLWSFGDGNFSTQQNPQHSYTATGNYTVWLIITNSNGCKDTAYRASYVDVYPDSTAFTADTLVECQGHPLPFTDPTLGSDSWYWDFGDGSSSTLQNPFHTYSAPGTYTISLNTTMPGGCTQSFNPYRTYIIRPYVAPVLEIEYNLSCKPWTAQFWPTDSSHSSYKWHFGDGDSSQLISPTHVYTSAGIYLVSLTVGATDSCYTIFYDTIRVGQSNVPVVNDSSVCFGTTQSFYVSDSLSFVQVEWDLGNGQIFSTNQFQYTYPSGASYQVTLYTEDTLGCRDTFTIDPLLVSNPQAMFQISSPTAGCDSLTLMVDNQSTGAESYVWDFGDGNSSTDSLPVYLYQQAGLYSLQLIASSAGCHDTLILPDTLRILHPEAAFNFSSSGACLPVSTQFTDLSSTAVSWQWDFGDGNTSSMQNPLYTYTQIPGGPVSLTITDAWGCQDTDIQTNIAIDTASGTIDQPEGCIPHTAQFTCLSANAIAWEWNFGDGTTSSIENPQHTYTTGGSYTVSLVVHFPGGCSDTVVYPSMLTLANPQAAFSAGNVSGCSPISVNFNNLSIGAVDYLWRFGDGSTSTLFQPSHIYYLPGTYTVSLIATNSNGCNDTLELIDYVIIPGTYSDFEISNDTGCAMLQVQFTDSSLNASQWSWNFGDGFTSSLQHPVHSYQDTGSYTVTLITYDSLGCTSSYTYPVPIRIFPNPTAAFSSSLNSLCEEESVSFNNLSTGAVSYLWYFGDGDTSSILHPQHIYTAAGSITPMLIAMNSYGCTDSSSLSVPLSVLDKPIASFSLSDSIFCPMESITTINTSQQFIPGVYTWNDGNGNVYSQQQPQLHYPISGTYFLELIALSANGCSDTLIQPVQIAANPVAAGTLSDSLLCSPALVQFANASTGASQYIWYFGDGDSLQSAFPQHIYPIAGIYSPFLIAENIYGCRDTFSMNQALTVLSTPVALIGMTDTVLCSGESTYFESLSTDTIQPAYAWNFGNGQTSNLFSNQIQYADSGSYSISLIVLQYGMCADTAYASLTVHGTPQPDISVDVTEGCTPLSVQFTNSGSGSGLHQWSFGDGGTATGPLAQYVYLGAGIYQALLTVTSSEGCVASDSSGPVEALLTPVANFSLAEDTVCYNTPVQFINLSSQTDQESYSWSFGSSQVNPSVLFSTGSQDISLLVTNQNGCSDSLLSPMALYVLDSIPPAASALANVSVVNNSQVEINWFNSADKDLFAYSLYRLNPMSGQYQLLFTDSNAQPASAQINSQYIDFGLNTLDNVYTYKLSTEDFCRQKLPLDSLTAHTTINIESQVSGSSVLLSWSPYGGCPVNNYEITRTHLLSGQSTLLAIVPGIQFNYTDSNLYCPGEYSYQVKATGLCQTSYVSYSDTSGAILPNALATQQCEIVRTTVEDNRFILTEWLEPVLHPERVVSYLVLRSEDGKTYRQIALLPAGTQLYTDFDVEVDTHQYTYIITPLNDCDLEGILSNEGSSLLLGGEWEDYKVRLRWNPYSNWIDGVNSYLIEELQQDGTWKLIKQVPGNQTQTGFDY